MREKKKWWNYIYNVYIIDGLCTSRCWYILALLYCNWHFSCVYGDSSTSIQLSSNYTCNWVLQEMLVERWCWNLGSTTLFTSSLGKWWEMVLLQKPSHIKVVLFGHFLVLALVFVWGVLFYLRNFTVLVRAFWEEGKVNEAIEAVKDMEQRGVVGSAGVYYELACCLCHNGRWQEAMVQVSVLETFSLVGRYMKIAS